MAEEKTEENTQEENYKVGPFGVGRKTANFLYATKARLETELEDQRSRTYRLSGEGQEKDKRIGQLETDLQAENTKGEEARQSYEKTLGEKETTIKEFEGQTTGLNDQVQELERDLAGERRTKEETLGMLQERTGELQTANERYSTLKGEYGQLETDLRNATKQKSELGRQLQATITGLREENTGYQEKLDAAAKKATEQQEYINRLVRMIEEKNDLMGQQAQQISGLIDADSKSKRTIEGLERDNRTYNSQLDAANRGLQETGDALGRLIGTQRKLLADYKTLQQRVENGYLLEGPDADTARGLKSAAQDFNQLFSDFGRAFNETRRDLSRTVNDTCEDVSQRVNKAREDVNQGVDTAAKKTGKVVEKTSEVVGKAGEVVKETGDEITEVGRKVTNVLGGLFGKIGKAIDEAAKDDDE